MNIPRLSQEIPLLQAPLEMGGGVKTTDINNYGKGHGLIDMEMGAGAGGATMTLDNRFSHYGEHIDMEHVDSGMMLGQGNYSEYRGGIFDGMALSSEFLGEYYSSVSTQNGRESIEWDHEFCSVRLTFMFRLCLFAEIQPCSAAGPGEKLCVGVRL